MEEVVKPVFGEQSFMPVSVEKPVSQNFNQIAG